MERLRVNFAPAKRIKCWLALFTLLLLTGSLSAQSFQVGGTVRDSKGARLPGITVSIKGTNTGGTTDSSGAYTISVPSSNSVLVFSGVGFLEKQQAIGDRRLLNITLAEKANNLDEVVVIGYGQSVRKRDIGGSIASVNNKQIQERQPVNLFDALQGQAAAYWS
jgi:hypothetical protein